MIKQSGSNNQNVKLRNRILVFKLIATSRGISRVDLARATGLSKMTAGNIATELLNSGLIEEIESTEELNSVTNYGRRPIKLVVAPQSPCICGMLIKRGLLQVVLANLDGSIFAQKDYEYHTLQDSNHLMQLLLDGFSFLRQQTTRRILAVGISSLGPIDSSTGMILNPPYFYGIENLSITSIIAQHTGLPAYLVNDANAGALAEKLFGTGRDIANFTYLHIMNGIGAGFVLQNRLYHGDTGQSGEIGHTSINFSGPKCVCGNTGCLDLYANLDTMHHRIQELSQELAPYYQDSPLVHAACPSWVEIVAAGNHGDPLAISVLDEFCSYISYTLVDTLNLLDLSNVIVGYRSAVKGDLIETLLRRKIAKSILSGKYHDVHVIHSAFDGDAPLIGSIAIVADKIFSLHLPLE